MLLRLCMSRHVPVSRRPLALRYAIPLVGTGLAGILWLLLGEQLAPTPFLEFAAAVALSAWWGGLGPALTAIGIGTIASLLLYYLPLDPRGFTPMQAVMHLLMFLFVSLLIAALQVERQRAQDALAHDALHDLLTGLPNRRLFTDRLQQLLASSRRTRRSFVLVLLDLDGFKEVNDTRGHLQGDLVLAQVASRLRGHARASDTIARFGGDEFALLLPETDEVGARTMLGELRQVFAQPFVLGGDEASIHASMGMAVYPYQGTTAESLLMHADLAMYADKRTMARETGEDDSLVPRTA